MAEAWSEWVVGGQVCQLLVPAQRSPHGYTIVYLHDENELAPPAALVSAAEQLGLCLVCPRAPETWWSDRICPEFDLHRTATRFVRETIVQALAAEQGIRPPQIALLGTGSGGEGALRLAFKFPDTFPVVAALRPAVDFYLRWDHEPSLMAMYPDPEAARQASAILHIHPLYWPRNIWFACHPLDFWHSGAERLRMKLSALGIPQEYELDWEGAPAPETVLTPMATRAVQFALERLERERLRVV